jgi:hypothetical protein
MERAEKTLEILASKQGRQFHFHYEAKLHRVTRDVMIPVLPSASGLS